MASPPTTYAELKEEIADYIVRTDITSSYAPIVGWIKYVEAEINRKLRLREQEQRSTADYTVAAASRFLSVPTDMIEMLDVRIKKASEADTAYKKVGQIAPVRIHEWYETSANVPYKFTLRDEIEFNRLPAVDCTVMMHYVKRWDIATDSTNWLLTNHSDIYLYGALLRSEPRLKNDKRMTTWAMLYQDAFDELNEIADLSRDDAVLGMNDLASSRGSYNIVTDS